MGNVEKVELGKSANQSKAAAGKKAESQEPASIYIDPKVAKEVEAIKQMYGDDSFMEILANMDSDGSNISVQDVKAIQGLTPEKKAVNKEDVEIFKSAVNMYNANKEKVAKFSDVLNFTREYLDLASGEAGDDKYLIPDAKIEKAFKTAKITENDGEMIVEMEDAGDAEKAGRSVNFFSEYDKQIVKRTKKYSDGSEFKIYDSRAITQADALIKDGILPEDDNGREFTVGGVKYIYDSIRNSFWVKGQNEMYTYNEKEKKMVSYSDCYKDVAKRLYGEQFYEVYVNKNYSTGNPSGIDKKFKMTDEAIEMIVKDPTSVIGQVIKFNNENKDNKDLTEIFGDVDKMNEQLQLMLKYKAIEFSQDPNYAVGADMRGIVSINCQDNYSSDKNDTELFNSLYHGLVRTFQTADYTAEYRAKQAYTAADRAELIKKGELTEEAKNNIDEKSRYLISYRGRDFY